VGLPLNGRIALELPEGVVAVPMGGIV
jgi:hypothetical protein